MLDKLLNSCIEEKYTGDSTCFTTYTTMTSNNVRAMGSAVAVCERLVKQPVPSAYTRHTVRFLTLYLMTLPLALIPTAGWHTVPIITFIAWSFFSIKEIGSFIEEPFDKDMVLICLPQLISVIRNDIAEVLGPDMVSTPQMIALDRKMNEEARVIGREQSTFRDSFFYYL